MFIALMSRKGSLSPCSLSSKSVWEKDATSVPVMGKVSMMVCTSPGALVKTQVCRKFGFINFRDVSTTYFPFGGCPSRKCRSIVGHKNVTVISKSNRNVQLNRSIFFLNMTDI